MTSRKAAARPKSRTRTPAEHVPILAITLGLRPDELDDLRPGDVIRLVRRTVREESPGWYDVEMAFVRFEWIERPPRITYQHEPETVTQ